MARLNAQSSAQQNGEGANTPSTNENVAENNNANKGSEKIAKFQFIGSYTFHFGDKEYKKDDILEIDPKVFSKSFAPFAADWKKL